MRKQYRQKRRSCKLCKPHKMGGVFGAKRWKPKERWKPEDLSEVRYANRRGPKFSKIQDEVN